MKYWTTLKGEKLLVTEMETSHIENCINMLNRATSALDFEIIGMDEYGFGGSMTAMAYREEIETWEKQIKAFEKELKRRAKIDPLLVLKYKVAFRQ